MQGLAIKIEGLGKPEYATILKGAEERVLEAIKEAVVTSDPRTPSVCYRKRLKAVN